MEAKCGKKGKHEGFKERKEQMLPEENKVKTKTRTLDKLKTKTTRERNKKQQKQP